MAYVTEQRVRLAQTVIPYSDVTFVGGNWDSPQQFALVAGSWILGVWAQLDPGGIVFNGTRLDAWWTTDVGGGGLAVVPPYTFQLGGAQDDTSTGGIELADDAPSDNSFTLDGNRLDLAAGVWGQTRPLPARVATACNLYATLNTDGTTFTSGTIRIYALIAEPAS